MNQDQFLSLIQSAFKIGGMWLAHKGYTDKSGTEILLGAAPVIGGVIWAFLHHGDKKAPSVPVPITVFAALLIPLMLTGCATQGVPPTKLSIVDPATGARVDYSGPKQVTLDALDTSLTKPDGTTVKVSLKGLQATNAPDVIQTAGAADAARITATAGLVHEVGATLGAAAGTALKAAAGVPASPVTPGPSSIAFPPTPTAPNVPKPVILDDGAIVLTPAPTP